MHHPAQPRVYLLCSTSFFPNKRFCFCLAEALIDLITRSIWLSNPSVPWRILALVLYFNGVHVLVKARRQKVNTVCNAKYFAEWFSLESISYSVIFFLSARHWMLSCALQPVVVAWVFRRAACLKRPRKLALYTSEPAVLSSVVLVVFTSLLALLHFWLSFLFNDAHVWRNFLQLYQHFQ